MTIDLDLSFGARLEAGMKDAHNKIDRIQKTVDTLRAQEPEDIRLQAVGSVASGDLGLNFGGPDAGYRWMVRRIIVGGLQWTTAASGTAEVYVTGISNIGGVGAGTGYVSYRQLSDLADQASSLPNKAYYGLHELPVKANESLVIVIHSPSASQQYTASVQLQLFRSVTERQGFAA